LTIMVIPIISALTIELISKTPIALKEGMVSLGATKLETIKHISIPFARLGMLAAVILGLGRALGETMAVTMVIGNSYQLPFPFVSMFWPATTITSKIASEFNEAAPGIEVSSLIEMALVLLIITVMINVFSRFMMKRITKRGFD
jgi:phosphate transport system permease protein